MAHSTAYRASILGAWCSHVVGSTAAQEDTPGIIDLTLDQPLGAGQKMPRRKGKRERAEAKLGRLQSESGDVAASGIKSHAAEHTIGTSPKTMTQMVEASGIEAQRIHTGPNLVGAGVHTTSTKSSQPTSSIGAFGAQPRDQDFAFNSVAQPFRPLMRRPQAPISVSQVATASVPSFKILPPWRVDKPYRPSTVPNYQALPIIPLGQHQPYMPIGMSNVAMTLDRLPSPKHGLPSVGQSVRALSTEPRREGERRRNKESSELPVAHADNRQTLLLSEATYRQSPQPERLPGKLNKSLSAPEPTAEYLLLAGLPPILRTDPQRLLLVLDLNGTLLYRKKASSAYRPRSSLQPFLKYCFTHHSVLVWSSATPSNVTSICSKLFDPMQRQQLLGEWGRDTLDLSNEEYYSKCQVYKRMERIWEGKALRDSHPDHTSGGRWSQANTLLLDDSVSKARAQPHNLVEIPEYTRTAGKEKGKDILGQVIAYLEEARMWKDVSTFVKRKKFVVDGGWTWNWKIGGMVEEVEDEDESDEGGVKLDAY